MTESIRAFVFVVVLAFPTFFIAERALSREVFSGELISKLKWVWLAITAAVFLTGSFWLYAFTTFSILAYARKRMLIEPLALYAFLLCAAPPTEVVMPGVLGIQSFVYLTHSRLLALALLLPGALKVRRLQIPWTITDKFVASYVCWIVVKVALDLPLTQALRYGSHALMDVFLPYYVFSRVGGDERKILDLLISVLLSGVVVSTLAIFESAKKWLLYSSVSSMWLDLGTSVYITRGDALRAVTSLGHSLVLGFFLMTCVPTLVTFYPEMKTGWAKRIISAILCGGLIAALSRGPWIGAAIGAVLSVMSGRNVRTRAAWLIVFSISISLAIWMLPPDNVVVRSIPFIGNIDPENVEYRQRLAEVSMTVLQQNLWFGDFFYLQNPLMEQMRQGQGIIDIVNYFVGVALPLGLFGVCLFSISLISSIAIVIRAGMRLDGEVLLRQKLGTVLLSSVLAISVTLFGVSDFGIISQLLWLLIGLCGAYSRIQQADLKSRTEDFHSTTRK